MLVFMIIVYRVPGLMADLALVVYVVALLALLSAAKATLTLPGIAGFVLSIGMAVDANVLIFERLKEELWAGKTLRAAVRTGFARAFATVFDSHVTTIVGAGVLFLLGTGHGQRLCVHALLGDGILAGDAPCTSRASSWTSSSIATWSLRTTRTAQADRAARGREVGELACSFGA